MSVLIPSPAMAVAVAALLAACGGLAVAATSSKPALIRACANKKTGALRLASKCRRSERSVSWNKEGVAGPQGLTGATGATGARGAPGNEGAKGEAGLKGETGQKGETGAPGATHVVVRVGAPTSIEAGKTGFAYVECGTGEVVTGGGAFNENAAGVYLLQSGPSGTSVWEVSYDNTTAFAHNVTARAICVSP